MRAKNGILPIIGCWLGVVVALVALKIKKMIKNIYFWGFIVLVGVINGFLVVYAINKCLEIFGFPFC
jgi:hypothetical protein